MRNFTYFRPTTAEQAVGLLENRWGNTEILAGGTDLLDLQKEYVAQPGRVVSLSAIDALASIAFAKNAATIGARATLATIANHQQIKLHYPGLAAAAGQVGGPQIRNMGTLGGNLCQRNRCWYFRDEHVNCLLKGGQRCFALDGENKYHALFNQGHRCVIVNPSTLAPALIAVGASVEILGPKGRRTTELAKFFSAPSGPNERETTLAPNELVTSVSIPITGINNASYEVRHKQSYDWPLVQAAVAFQGGRDGNRTSDIRIVLGHVSPTPYLVSPDVVQNLRNGPITEASAAAAGRAVAALADKTKPLSQVGYKIKLVEVAVKRALLLAAQMKPYWEV